MEIAGKIKHRVKRVVKRIIRKTASASGVILMYHRIGNRKMDPWEIFVSEENFRAQLKLLKKSFNVYLLSDMTSILNREKGRRGNVFITFDDGCSDNFETALPLLDKYALPATFFIPTGILNGQSVFWWEALDSLFWNKTRLPEIIELGSEANRFSRILSPEIQKGNATEELGWSANREPAPSLKCQLYLDICNWIRVQNPEEQQTITNQLMLLSGEEASANNFFNKMSSEQINKLSKNNFEIGGHTIRHPALKYHNYPLQQEEIKGCKSKLEKITGKAVVSFAYPHGEYNGDTIHILNECGITYACTTDWGAIYPETDKLTLPRMLVRDTDLKFFRKQLDYLFNP